MIYEFELGLYVDAETDDEAYAKINTLLTVAYELDSEGDPALEFVGKHDPNVTHTATYAKDLATKYVGTICKRKNKNEGL